jgi:hypothetical protein
MSRDQVKKGLGYGGTVTMATLLTDLRLGASFHALIVDLPFNDPK